MAGFDWGKLIVYQVKDFSIKSEKLPCPSHGNIRQLFLQYYC